MATYAIVSGAVAVVCIGAITYLNWTTEEKIQNQTSKSGQVAVNKGDSSLGGEVAKSTAILGGVDVPFSFGIPLFFLPGKKKKNKDAEQQTAEEIAAKDCPGGKCLPGESTCFVAGTLVLTPTGYRKIEDIKVGDEVLSVAEDSPWATAEVEEEHVEDAGALGDLSDEESDVLDDEGDVSDEEDDALASDPADEASEPPALAPPAASGSTAIVKQ